MFMHSENLRIYENAKVCPQNAMRTIAAGKLKGKSDINPMWRIKKLTELFGPCGVGWKIHDEMYWTEQGANGEVAAWCRLSLSIKYNDDWSEPIPGIGGSMLINTERGNLVTNDEAFKMAYTDAISVSCKMLGIAADVYWELDKTKYTVHPTPPITEPAPIHSAPSTANDLPICSVCGQVIDPRLNKGKLYGVGEIIENTVRLYGKQMCWDCMLKKQEESKNAK